MVGKHLFRSTVLNNLDVLPRFSADVMHGKGPNLACF